MAQVWVKVTGDSDVQYGTKHFKKGVPTAMEEEDYIEMKDFMKLELCEAPIAPATKAIKPDAK